MYWEIGLVAMVMPAMKAPISSDSPRALAASAMPRHQPIASRNMYSWKRSKRRISGSST